MGVYSFEGRTPMIGNGSYIFPGATIIGGVIIGDDVWVGPGAVLRGDYGSIHIGAFSAIEDNVVVHARPGEKTEIGQHVTIGHGAVVHTATIGNWAVIGMKSVVSDISKIGEWAAIGEGAVVKSKSSISPGKIAVGIPAKEIGFVSDEYRRIWTDYKNNYNTFCRRYSENLTEIGPRKR